MKKSQSSKEISLESKPKLAKSSVCVEQPDGTLAIMPKDTSTHFYVIDGCAAKCFQLFNGKNTLDKISLQVAKKNHTTPETVQYHLNQFVKELLTIKLIEIP